MGIKKEAIPDLYLTYRKITMLNQSAQTEPLPNSPQHSEPRLPIPTSPYHTLSRRALTA